jgi:HSP20 family protein
MYNDFNSLFDNFFNSVNSTRIPPVDVAEDSDGYFIDVEIPGYDKTDIDLKIESYSITIQTSDAFNNNVKESKSGTEYLINETNLNKIFKRTFYLPNDIDESQIKAEFSNGVLGIRIPKLNKVLTKTIEILDS